MSFEDFLGKNRWRVSVNSGSTKCQVDEMISIDGSEKDVIVRCLPDDHFYASGIYDDQSDVIFGRNKSYTLRLGNNKSLLICDFSGGPVAITGSWTAEDIGNRGDDGKVLPVTANPLEG